MMLRRAWSSFFILTLVILLAAGCRTRSDIFTIAMDTQFSSLNSLTGTADANAERLRTLMFNMLVKKNENFEYVGELASDIKDLDNGSTISFTLRDGVTFHDGKPLTSADVKYTFDTLFAVPNTTKASAFYETVDGATKPHILAIETPDAKTVNFKISRPSLKNQLLANLVAIPIIQNGADIKTLAENPNGTGAYKFVRFDAGQNIVELEAYPNYWEGAANIKKIQVKTVSDSNAIQAELKSGRVDVAPMMNNLSPDTINALSQDPNLRIDKQESANIQLITFNTQAKPFDNIKVRQAFAYAIDREKLVNQLLSGQATIAHSILPEKSWAYSVGTKYNFDEAKAAQLLDEAGFKKGADGKRFSQPIRFKIVSGNSAISQYAQVIQEDLAKIGIPISVEPAELSTLLDQLKKGQFDMTMTRWVGGNQDPIFLRDLFATSEIPNEARAGRNRSRYSNAELDKILTEAAAATDRAAAKEMYVKAQDIISRELPAFPLWYPANMFVRNKRVGEIKANAGGDWTFVRTLTQTQ